MDQLEHETRAWNVYDRFQGRPLDELKDIQQTRSLPYAVAAVNVCGGLNIGTMLRTSVIFAAEQFFLIGRRRYDRRSTVGAQNYIAVDYLEMEIDSALEEIVKQGYTPVCVEQGGVLLEHFDFARIKKPCLILGSESEGLPSSVVDRYPTVSIAQFGILRSLNVSAAASIVINSCANRLKNI